jgi:hypothetical protein
VNIWVRGAAPAPEMGWTKEVCARARTTRRSRGPMLFSAMNTACSAACFCARTAWVMRGGRWIFPRGGRSTARGALDFPRDTPGRARACSTQSQVCSEKKKSSHASAKPGGAPMDSLNRLGAIAKSKSLGERA